MPITLNKFLVVEMTGNNSLPQLQAGAEDYSTAKALQIRIQNEIDLDQRTINVKPNPVLIYKLVEKDSDESY